MAKVSIYTLAKELNMTPSMVSRAFTPGARIDPDKRKQVLDAAKKHNYVPNKFASRLSGHEIKIGVLINLKFKNDIDKILDGIANAYELLKSYKVVYDVTILDPENTPISIYENAFETYASFDGIILTGVNDNKYTALINSLYEKNKNIVQVQSINEKANCLFVIKQDEKAASYIAAEFLCNCLHFSDSKNVVLFTGNTENFVHASARNAFLEACNEFGLNVVEVYDMKYDEKFLEKAVLDAFNKHSDIRGIYTTSSMSNEICRYLEKNQQSIPFVGFDINSDVRTYMEKGIMTSTIYQNVKKQAQIAFEKLVMHIIDGQKIEKIISTDVQLVFKSNIHKF